MSDTSNRTEIHCGNSKELFDTWGNQNVSFAPIQNICTDSIRLIKFANSGVAVNITYLDGYIPTETGSTTSPPTATTTPMTGGELVISLFSLILIFLLLAILIITITTGIRIKETAKDFRNE
jgi:hypothetical protein